MKKILYVFITLGFGLYCFVLGIAVRNNQIVPPTPPLREFNQELLWTYIQNYKQDSGLQPYIKDQNLCESTDRRFDQTSKSSYHTGFKEEADALMEITKFRNVGENLADFSYSSEPNEKFPLNMWLDSESHRKNLDNPAYTHSCLRCSNTHCVQLFAGY